MSYIHIQMEVDICISNLATRVVRFSMKHVASDFSLLLLMYKFQIASSGKAILTLL
jgi:hypothetical protein